MGRKKKSTFKRVSLCGASIPEVVIKYIEESYMKLFAERVGLSLDVVSKLKPLLKTTTMGIEAGPSNSSIELDANWWTAKIVSMEIPAMPEDTNNGKLSFPMIPEFEEITTQNGLAVSCANTINGVLANLEREMKSLHHVIYSVPEAAQFIRAEKKKGLETRKASKFIPIVLENKEAWIEAILFYKLNRQLFK
jgi:hypothetical protein